MLGITGDVALWNIPVCSFLSNNNGYTLVPNCGFSKPYYEVKPIECAFAAIHQSTLSTNPPIHPKIPNTVQCETDTRTGQARRRTRHISQDTPPTTRTP